VKSLLTYVVLVGLPTAGVLGVLNAGRSLRAPYAVGGEWRITAGPLADSAFVVQQSGVHVAVVLGGSRLGGRLRGDTLEVRGAGTGAAGACGPEGGTTLTATVDASARPRRLLGTLARGGAECAAVPIEAVHVPAPARSGRAH
jgi:hypothetical protein